MMDYTNVCREKPNDTLKAQNGQEMVETRGWWWESGKLN